MGLGKLYLEASILDLTHYQAIDCGMLMNLGIMVYPCLVPYIASEGKQFNNQAENLNEFA